MVGVVELVVGIVLGGDVVGDDLVFERSERLQQRGAASGLLEGLGGAARLGLRETERVELAERAHLEADKRSCEAAPVSAERAGLTVPGGNLGPGVVVGHGGGGLGLGGAQRCGWG